MYTDSLGLGGAEISLGHLVAAVSDKIEITVVGVSEPVVNAIAAQRSSAKKIVLPPTGIASLTAHVATLHHLRPDVVHLNLCTPWAGATGLAAALTVPGARVVRVDQLPLRTTDALTLWRTRSLSLRVDAHVAVGDASARRMEDFYALGRHSVLSVPNGVPDNAFEPAHTPARKDHRLIVGTIGRMDAVKAHDILLRAIAQVEDAYLVIWGDGAERNALEQLVKDLGIGDRVSLPGWSNNPRAHLPNVDIFALPSRSEGFPLAIVEAMLAARPVNAGGQRARGRHRGRNWAVSRERRPDGSGQSPASVARGCCPARSPREARSSPGGRTVYGPDDGPALRAHLAKAGRDAAIAPTTSPAPP